MNLNENIQRIKEMMGIDDSRLTFNQISEVLNDTIKELYNTKI
jgi:hypothetical protein